MIGKQKEVQGKYMVLLTVCGQYLVNGGTEFTYEDSHRSVKAAHDTGIVSVSVCKHVFEWSFNEVHPIHNSFTSIQRYRLIVLLERVWAIVKREQCTGMHIDDINDTVYMTWCTVPRAVNFDEEYVESTTGTPMILPWFVNPWYMWPSSSSGDVCSWGGGFRCKRTVCMSRSSYQDTWIIYEPSLLIFR